MVAKPSGSDSPARSRRRLSVMTPEDWTEHLRRPDSLEQRLTAQTADIEQLKREASSRSDALFVMGSRMDSLEASVDVYKNTVSAMASRIDGHAQQSAQDAVAMVIELRSELELIRDRFNIVERGFDTFDSGIQAWKMRNARHMN